MPISHAIDPLKPDGATQTGSVVPGEFQQLKTDVQERMEDSIVDTTVATWNSTTKKALQKGIARAYLDVQANEATLTPVNSGNLFVASDANNTKALRYYDGAAWQHVPVGTPNLIAAAITKAKMGAASVTVWQTEIIETADRTQNAAAYILAGTNTFTLTPNSLSSVVIFTFIGHHWKNTAGFGTVRIQKTTAGATGIRTLATANCPPSGTGGVGTAWPVCLVGIMTGENTATTVRVEIASSNASVYHLDSLTQSVDALGTASSSKFNAVEIMF